MRNFKKLLLSSVTIFLFVSLLSGCSNGSEEIDTEEESQTEIELKALQDEYDTLSTDYENVKDQLASTQSNYQDLSSSYNELETKYNNLNTRYNELNSKYNELNVNYNELIKEPEEITEENLEQVIFDLINQERAEAGVPPIQWHDGLHWYAKKHSMFMADRRMLEYSGESYYQEIFRGAGYKTTEDMASAAMLIWKHGIQYETNFLKADANNGAVGVVKSGEVYYITYYSHIY
jgi:uncharacterized protein YkwD